MSIEIVRAAHTKIIEEAKKMWPHIADKLSVSQVSFDLKGRCAGVAYRRHGIYGVRYNYEACIKYTDEQAKQTVPHEIAHLVCYLDPRLGKNHDYGWWRVCIQLGGDGTRCHSMKLAPAKKTVRYLYRATCGTEIEVSAIMHRKIQQGENRVIRRTRGKVTASSWVRPENPQPTNEITITPVQVPPNMPSAGMFKTKAEHVRQIIYEAKKAGKPIDWLLSGLVFTAAAAAVGLDKNLYKTYVQNNWDRVKVGIESLLNV